jgi:rod shape-determining protein MreC
MRSQSKSWSIALISLGLLFCLSIYFLSVDVPQDKDSAWYERAFFSMAGKFQSGARTVSDKVVGTVDAYFFLVAVKKENRDLKNQIHQLEQKNLLFKELLRQNKVLRELHGLQEKVAWTTLTARVIGHSPRAEFRLMTIDRGETHGVRRGMPIISSKGLVGQVYRIGDRSSQVLLLTDPTSAIDVRIEPSGARGLMMGRVKSLTIDRSYYVSAIEFILKKYLIKMGADVVTSGLDGVFPEGIPVGFVSQITQDDDQVVQEAEVIPAADLMTLREVIVVTAWKNQ